MEQREQNKKLKNPYHTRSALLVVHSCALNITVPISSSTAVSSREFQCMCIDVYISIQLIALFRAKIGQHKKINTFSHVSQASDIVRMRWVDSVQGVRSFGPLFPVSCVNKECHSSTFNRTSKYNRTHARTLQPNTPHTKLKQDE